MAAKHETTSDKRGDVQSPIRVGQKVLIRAVTMYYTGEIVGVTDQEILIAKAAWIADTGRFSQALAKGASALNEIEPYPDDAVVSVGRGAVIDVVTWTHELPTEVK